MDYTVTSANASVLYPGDDKPRVTKLQTYALYSDVSYPQRVSRTVVTGLYTDASIALRVSKLHGYVLFSLEQREPIINVRPDNSFVREPNPYRPTLPEEISIISPDLYEHMREQVETTREQHNVTQAGDSTFPWEMLTEIGPDRQFTLGSLGRFYHDDHGIILARYCQFASMAQGKWINGPVGRLRSDDVVTWRVTNDPKLSSADDVVGILGSFRQCPNDWYGWVVTQGANHAPLLIDYLEPGVGRNQPLVWGANFEQVSAKGKGRILGRALSNYRAVNEFQYQFDVGTVFLDLEGPSAESLVAMLGTTFEALGNRVDKLQELLDRLDVDDLANRLDAITKTLEASTDSLTLLKELSPDIASIKRRLNALEAYNSEGTLYNRIMGELDPRINALENTLAGLNIEDYSGALQGIRDTLASVNETLNDLELESRIQLIPLVDGGIPPKLVYTSDGGLVFVEAKR